MHRVSRWQLLLVLAVSHASYALAQHGPDHGARAARIARAFPCRPLPFTIAPILPGSTSPIDCSLVRAAMHEIARGRALRLGVALADTARITGARVMSNHFRGLNGAPDEAYWLVSLQIRDRTLPLEIHIDQRSDSIAVWNGEGGAVPGRTRGGSNPTSRRSAYIYLVSTARPDPVARTCKTCSSIIPSASTNCPNCGTRVTMGVREIIAAILLAAAVLAGALI